MKNNENVKEKKSFKEVVVENKGKIIAGVSIVTATAVGVVLCKNAIEIKNLNTLVDSQIKLNEAQGELNHKCALGSQAGGLAASLALSVWRVSSHGPASFFFDDFLKISLYHHLSMSRLSSPSH